MKVLSDFGKRILSWLKKRRSNKWMKIYALEECLQDGLNELVTNTSQFAIDLNGVRIKVWFPIDKSVVKRMNHQVMLEFRDELRISTRSFWVLGVALTGAFDCALYILNDYENYEVDKKLVRKFNKELCNKYYAIVKDNMIKSGSLT